MRLKLAAVAVVAFLLGSVAGPMVAGTALAPITLQPGQQITIIAADLPTPTPTVAPTPTPTPTPAPTPTPTPVPTPTPTPVGRPFAAPVTTRTVNVPSTINATGATDVTAALRAFFGTVPNGSTIVFPAGAVYKTSTELLLSGRSNLVFEGNGATLHQVGTAYDSVFRLVSDSHITFRNLTIYADNPDPGKVLAFRGGGAENGHGLSIRGSSYVEIDHVTLRNIWGDGVYIEAWTAWSSYVWMHDSVVDGAGRNGITLNSGRNIWITGNVIGRAQLFAIDLEPNDTISGAEHVWITGNSFGRYGFTTTYICFVFGIVGADGALGNDIEFSGNTVAGGAAGYDGKALALNTIVWRSRVSNIRFLNNAGTTSASGTGWPGGVLHFQQVDGLTVTGNKQTVSAGSLVSITDSTGVTYTP